MDGAVFDKAGKKPNGIRSYAVSDDLPDELPVTDAELDLLERALSAVIDDILVDSGGAKRTA
ncbi:MAG: hypothetical protein AB7P52_05270 [Alphaproteobacteria bacterium]